MRLEGEKIKARIGPREDASRNFGSVECKTVDGEELIDTLKSQIKGVTKNEAGVYQVELNNQVEWLTGHNPQGWLGERLTADQDNINRLMAEALAVATLNKFYENSEDGVPENVTAAEHEVVGEIAWRLAKNPWHDAKKNLKMNLHTDVSKALDWVEENSGDEKHHGWVPITLGGLGIVSVACTATVDARTPIVETTQAPKSTATEEFIVFTPTTEVTKTPEPTPTPEATKNPYEIDAEKVYVMPPSYEDVVANPEKYQQGPDPLADIEFFKNWWLNEMIPVLGDQRSKSVNSYTPLKHYGDEWWTWDQLKPDSKPLNGQPQFFYFRHNEVIFPVLILTVGDAANNYGTYALILHSEDPSVNDDGLDAIKYLYEGKPIRMVVGTKKIFGVLDEYTQQLVEDGYNWSNYDGNVWLEYNDGTPWFEIEDKFAIGVGEVLVWH